MAARAPAADRLGRRFTAVPADARPPRSRHTGGAAPLLAPPPVSPRRDDGIPGRHGDHGAGWHHGRGGRRDPGPGGGPISGTGGARAPATAVAPAAEPRRV